MALCPNIFVMMKSKCVPIVMLVSQNAQFGHMLSHIGWVIANACLIDGVKPSEFNRALVQPLVMRSSL